MAKNQQRTALFAGSFDPFTTGHKSIADRGLALFDRLIIAIGHNPDKRHHEDITERIKRIRSYFAPEAPVEVIAYDGLTVETAMELGAGALLRGARTVMDFESERTLADINRNISGIETVILYTLPELAMVSSSMVRELQRYGKDVTAFLPTPYKPE